MDNTELEMNITMMESEPDDQPVQPQPRTSYFRVFSAAGVLGLLACAVVVSPTDLGSLLQLQAGKEDLAMKAETSSRRRKDLKNVATMLKEITHGWKPSPDSLVPITTSHQGSLIFNISKLVRYAEGRLGSLHGTHVCKIQADSTKQWARSNNVGVKVEGAYSTGFATIEASASADLSVSQHEANSYKFAQIRTKVLLAQIRMPNPLIYADNLYSLLQKPLRDKLNSVKTATDAESVVDAVGPFYISSAEFGALLTMTTRESKTSSQSTFQLMSKLEASYSDVVGDRVGGSAHYSFGFNQKSSSSTQEFWLHANGGSPSTLLSEGLTAWEGTIEKTTPAVISYSLSGIQDLISDPVAKKLVEQEVNKRSAECNSCPKDVSALQGQIKWARSPEYCLSVQHPHSRASQNYLWLWRCASPDDKTQQWILPKAAPGKTAEGFMKWAVHPQLCVNILGFEDFAGIDFWLWPCTDSKDWFKVQSAGQTSELSLKWTKYKQCLTLQGGNASNGAKIVTEPCTYSLGQQWILPNAE